MSDKNSNQNATDVKKNGNSRRSVLKKAALGMTGALHVAMLPSGCGAQKTETGPGREAYWGPGVAPGDPPDTTPGPTPIRLGTFFRVQPKQLPDIDIDGEVSTLRDQGFTAFVTPGELIQALTPQQLDSLNASLVRHDVVIAATIGNRYTNFIHPDAAIRQKYLKNLATFLETAESVNCLAVPTICGTVAPETPDGASFLDLFRKEYRYSVHNDNWSLATWKLLVTSIKQVLRDTAGMKASIAMEAQVTTTIDTPLAHRRLIDDVGDSRLGVELDPVNMMTLDWFFRTTELLHECFDLLGETILTCHAKDSVIWPNRQTLHVQEVCAGRGVMDYDTYVALMTRLEWPRMLLPEHIPADQMSEAYLFLRAKMRGVGAKLYGSRT